jgi:hypothetical protein
MSEPERKRRRKWDVPDPTASKTTTTTTSTPEKPQTTSEKIPVIVNTTTTTTTPEKPPAPSEKAQKDTLQAITQVLAARSPGETHTVEIDINTCPAATRFLLTKGQVHEQILKETGAVVITRGVFVPAAELATTAGKPLHLHVSAKTKESLNEAEKKIREMMRTSKESAVLGALLSAQVPITMEVEPEFNLNGKLLGPKGQYLRNITNDSGGAKVHLRGRDSTPNASEADQLHIHITANSQPVLDRAKKLAGDLIASVQKQYEEFKQKKAAGPQYPPMVQPYSVPFMPPYPYAPYPTFGGFPPFSGRPPFGYPPRGHGAYPPMPGPGYSVPSTGDPSASYPNYYPDPNNSTSGHSGNDTAIKTENNSDSSSAANSNTTDTSNTASSNTENSVTDQSYIDQMNSYYGYGYSQSAGYESYNYHYGYYPGMESAVGTEKASDTVNNGGVESNTNPASGNGDQAYDYNYPPGAYGELFGSTAAYYNNDQRTPSTQN